MNSRINGDASAQHLAASASTSAPAAPGNAADAAAAITTVFQDPENYNAKHPLQHRWTLWADAPPVSASPSSSSFSSPFSSSFPSSQPPPPKPAQHNWEANVKPVITFDTVEDLWGAVNNLKKGSELGPGANYHLFKEGVRPAWEDPANINGGKWVAVVPKTKRSELDAMWLNTILAVVGETFPESDEICGVVMSIRVKQDRISLWTKTASSAESAKAAGIHWKTILALPDHERIGFQAHSDALKKDSSYFNDDLYVV
ncbi:eukaryotic initiation factor 4E putative [Geranomyces variabilis]|nr:eukaryotic initiation factor 4E putative [Geranomyces variabilis]KAJ3141280.1 hypothetical protein HDU90_007307 [Geranomyces variabilis]